MAHHSQPGGSGGLESTTPHIGTLTALSSLAVFGASIWYAVTHPRKAVLVVIAATVLVLLMPAIDVNNPLYFLLVLAGGWWIASSDSSDTESSEPDTQSRVDGK